MKGYSYLLLVAGATGCVPGTLSEEEQEGIHSELGRLYGGADASAAGAAGTATLSTAPPGGGVPSGSQSPTSSVPPGSLPSPPTDDVPPAPVGVGQPPSANTAEPPGSGSVAPPPSDAPAPPAVPTPNSEPPSSDLPPAEPPPAEPPPAVAVIDACVTEVFTSSCSGTVCHYGGIVNLPPDLERDNLFDLLTTEASTCAAAATTLINLDDPTQSYLMQKIRGEQPGTCGGPMPPAGSPPLTDAQLQCLESWLASL